MKPAHKSKTIFAGVTAALTSLTAIILHYTGVAPLDPAMLGASISALISGVVFTVLRAITKEPIGSAGDNTSGPGSVLCLLCVLAFLSVGPGCVRHFKAKKSVDIMIKKKPCEVTIKSDGDLVFRLSGPMACGVK